MSKDGRILVPNEVILINHPWISYLVDIFKQIDKIKNGPHTISR